MDRLAGLDDETRDLLRTAALIGRDVGLDLLASAAHLDVSGCLGRLQPVEGAGILEASPAHPSSLRFTHDLVREAVVETTPASVAGPLHLRIADALEATAQNHDTAAESIAYHLWAAGRLADPARTATALLRAGRRAAGRSALEAAERQLRLSAQVARAAGRTDLELTALTQLTAVIGMRSMYGFTSLDLMERAEELARSFSRDVEAWGFLYTRWAAHAQALELHRSGPLARLLLEQSSGSGDPFVVASGRQAWGIHQWCIGNIGEAYRYLTGTRELVLDLAPREDDPVRHDLQLLMTGMLAETVALHGEVEEARALLDALRAAAGDDAYAVAMWATFAARIATFVGDPAAALRAADIGIAMDPQFSFVFLGTYQRLARCWAVGLTGGDPARAGAEAEEIIAANLLDPPRSCVATWFGVLGDIWMASGRLDDAAAALDRADSLVEAYGQRYAEGLLLLLRARLDRARGEPVSVVRSAADKARRLSQERGAHLFARRAEAFLEELGQP
jgi:hypothetical protein